MKRGNKNHMRKDPPPRSVRQETRQTRMAGGNFLDKLCAYRDLNAHALFSSLGRLLGSPFTTIMTVAVLAIAISLASGFYVLVMNFEQLTSNLETSNQLSLFLREDVTETDAKKVVERIKQNANVKSVKLITKEQALSEFKTYSGFGAAIDALEENPLPFVVSVLPQNALEAQEDLAALQKSFKQLPEVDFMQMDLQWVERLQSIIALARLFAVLLNLLLGLAVLFVIGNTIRLELHSRHDEVVIAKLVGATNAFIARPFLYTGFWIGFISGSCAWFIVAVSMLVLRTPVENLSGLYQGSFHLLFLSVSESLALIAISSVLGVLGAWAVLVYQLQQTNSE